MQKLSSLEEEVYRVKEDLLLKNFFDKSRKDKAKVLRLQQVKNYQERLQSGFNLTLSRTPRQSDATRNVVFSPSSLVQDAIKDGNKFEVLDLLSKGVPVNFNDVQGEGMSLLHQACLYDDYIMAQALIKQGASINVRDDYGCTPIHICCLWDSLKCAQFLLSNNASTDILNIDGNFAVDLAPENSHLKAMMKKHMQQKLKIDEKTRHLITSFKVDTNTGQLQSLRNKTQKKMLQDIRQLLEDGSSVDMLSTAGVSLLHIAVTNGYVSAARMLLENSANVNSADLQLWTPLHCAAKFGQTKMVRLLLSHYANPHARNINGFTPRELAKDPETATMLLSAEDTFLGHMPHDLSKQKTPSKPKRFSASLLDHCEEEEEVTRINSKIISSTKISKRDIIKEKEIISQLGEELKQELKAEMLFHPPSSQASVSCIPTWYQMMPPPVPPRDDPPQIHSPLASTKKIPIFSEAAKTNQMHDERFLNAVVTIQRAFRRFLASRRTLTSPLAFALQNIDDYGSSFYDEMVFQNAEDIARENDRQRSRKSLQRNSWSNNRRRSIRDSATHRPLSTGTLLMPHAPDDTEIWLPQSTMHNPYQHPMPPDVVPHYQDKDFPWNTMPRGGQRKPLKESGSGSTDSGVSVGSTHKEYLQLTKTVKESLIIAENPELQSPQHAATLPRNLTLSVQRPHAPPTYRMPPLTPTVATLIHTAAIPVRKQKKSGTPPANGTQRMRPVAPVGGPPENPYLLPNGPDAQVRSRSSNTRDHKYGTLLSNRGDVLRDARMQNINNQELSGIQNRHSWSGEQEECSTNFGRESSRPQHHPIVSPSSNAGKRNFSEGAHTPSDINPHFTLPPPSSQRKNTKPRHSDTMPPPPPRRAPTTKLSSSTESIQQPRKSSTPCYSSSPPHPESSRADMQRHMSLPLVKHQPNTGLSLGIHDSSPEEELPVVPPPLPLYTPQALTPKDNHQESITRNSVAFPAPPPPDVLLYDTMKNMGSLKRNQSDNFLDLPPPPPTL